MAKGTLQTVDRALQLLELLSEYPSGLTTKEIETQLELNKLNVHRLLVTLENKGFVERQNNAYVIGLKMVEISSMKLNNIELKTEAVPYLRELVDLLGQPAQIAIQSGTDAVFIEKIQSVNSLRMYSQIGKRIPVYCSSVGKALLMDRSDEEILKLLEKVEFEAITPSTLKTPEDVLNEIRTARITGYTIDNEEHELSIFCIAVPIYDYRGDIIAAVSTAGKNKTFLENPDAEMITAVKEVGKKISKRLGYFC